jgi:putative glutamine amidotransferase
MRMAPQTRPYIGVNTDFLPTHKLSPAQIRLNMGYIDAIIAAGGFPLVLPPIAKDVDLDAFLDRVDGFVLTGGLDMDPRRVGQTAHHAVQPMPERRDASDRALVRKILQRQMPVLGVGVGMQQVNAALGGSLYPHLPEDLPRAMPHYDPTGGPHRHAVMLEPGTRMEEIYGAGEIRVNSAHHQAVRQPGTGLRIGARAPDGVIEAIESTDPNWFCIGVQWHPESETATALDLQLFECFLQACVRQAQALQLAA